MQQQPLSRNRIFILLFIAGIFAVIGFSMFLTTISWYAISELESATAVGLVLIAATIPRLVMMIFGGVVADKYKKTTIMFATNLIQAIMLFSMYLFVANDLLTLTVLLVLAGVFGMLDAFFGPASVSLIPKVVPKKQLQRANAIFQGADQIAFIIGPIVAGITMESLGVAASFLIATILVFLSALFIFPPFLKAPVDESVPQSPSYGIIAGFVSVGVPVQIVLFGLGITGMLIALVVFFKAKEFRHV